MYRQSVPSAAPTCTTRKSQTCDLQLGSKMALLPSTFAVYLLTTTAALFFQGALSETTLHEDYMEFLKIVPFEEIVETIHHYNETDPEVRDFLKSLEDPEIREYALWLYKQPPLHKALDFLEQHEVPGYELLNNVMAAFGWPPLARPSPHGHHRSSRSVHKMAQDVRTLVPPLALFSFYSSKMKTSKEFREFVNILRSDEFNDMVLAAMEHKGYKKFTHILEDGGLDIDSLRRSLTTMFGWGRREKKKHSGGLFSKLFSAFFN